MKTLTRSLICAALLLSTTQAEEVTIKTRPSTMIILSEGRLTPPFTLYVPDSDDFRKGWDTSKAYWNYMGKVAGSYVGADSTCYGDALYFLPGRTESAFRQSEQAMKKAFTTDGKGEDTFRRFILKKSYPAKNVAPGLNASFAIYKPSVYSKPDFRHLYVHGYFYNTKLKQGVLLVCNVIPPKS